MSVPIKWFENTAHDGQLGAHLDERRLCGRTAPRCTLEAKYGRPNSSMMPTSLV